MLANPTDRPSFLDSPRREALAPRPTASAYAFDTEALSDLRPLSLIRELAPRSPVFGPSTGNGCVYFLQEGAVRMYRIAEDGHETSLGYVAPGEIFGIPILLRREPDDRFASVVCRSIVWRIPRDPFRRWIASRPCFAVALGAQLERRMRRLEDRVDDLAARDVRQRVLRALRELSNAFGRSDGNGSVVLDLPITQAELASLVGSTRQTVNASLRALLAEQILRRDGRRLVLVSSGVAPPAASAAAATPQG
jgi:CRP-like cAMP-binding protein